MNVEETENLWIPLGDGLRLSAKIWRPTSAEPLPALLEYLPYRKGDLTAISDAARYRYIAAHGYICIRVDARGTGESDGALDDEYSAIELSDGVKVIEWLATQLWCDGQVAMQGISWGGFNALQIAALQPAPLKTIITVASTDNRYTDDVHYSGGAILAADMPGWAASLTAVLCRPPDPAIVGDQWQALWLQRLHNLPHLLDRWLSHPLYDAYWRHGSVAENYAAITCPVLVIGGWADGYTDAAFRLIKSLNESSRAIIGPWSHGWPHRVAPGPTIGFLQETIRWLDHHLKGIDNPMDEAPRIRAWIQDWTVPAASYNERSGVWRAFDNFNQSSRTLAVNANGLDEAPGVPDQVSISSTLSVGKSAGAWCPFGLDDMPGNQRTEDANAVCFDSQPLAEDLVLFGLPGLEFTFKSATAHAQLIFRFCEVDESGNSLLLSRAVTNLCHTDNHTTLRSLEPDVTYISMINMSAIGHSVRKGHRLRLAVSTEYFPMIWPTGQDHKVTLLTGAHTKLTLPLADCLPVEVAFDAAAVSRPPAFERLTQPAYDSDYFESGETLSVASSTDSGLIRYPSGIAWRNQSHDRLSAQRNEAATCTAECARYSTMHRDEHRASIEIHSRLHASAGTILATTSVKAHTDDVVVFERHWQADRQK